MDSYPTMYGLLVHGIADTPGALAFASYKKHESEAYAEIETRTGHAPTPADIAMFERAASTPSALSMYRQIGDAILKEYLEESLAEAHAQLKEQFTNSAISRQLGRLQTELAGKRTFAGWFREVSANLTVSLMTLLVIASLVYGYRLLDGWIGGLGSKTGITQNAGHR